MESGIGLAYLLQHTATMMVRQSDQMLQERLGIGMSQLRILMMLQHEPNVRQRKLADRLGQTEASISRQIKLLQEKSLLAIRINPHSRREHLTVPTPKGVKLTQAALEVINQYNAPVIEKLSSKQQTQVAAVLTAMHGYICAPGRPYACDHPFENQ